MFRIGTVTCWSVRAEGLWCICRHGPVIVQWTDFVVFPNYIAVYVTYIFNLRLAKLHRRTCHFLLCIVIFTEYMVYMFYLNLFFSEWKSTYLMLYFIVASYVGWWMCFCVYLLQLNNAFGMQILWIYLACPSTVHITVQRTYINRWWRWCLLVLLTVVSSYAV